MKQKKLTRKELENVRRSEVVYFLRELDNLWSASENAQRSIDVVLTLVKLRIWLECEENTFEAISKKAIEYFHELEKGEI